MNSRLERELSLSKRELLLLRSEVAQKDIVLRLKTKMYQEILASKSQADAEIAELKETIIRLSQNTMLKSRAPTMQMGSGASMVEDDATGADGFVLGEKSSWKLPAVSELDEDSNVLQRQRHRALHLSSTDRAAGHPTAVAQCPPSLAGGRQAQEQPAWPCRRFQALPSPSDIGPSPEEDVALESMDNDAILEGHLMEAKPALEAGQAPAKQWAAASSHHRSLSSFYGAGVVQQEEFVGGPEPQGERPSSWQKVHQRSPDVQEVVSLRDLNLPGAGGGVLQQKLDATPDAPHSAPHGKVSSRVQHGIGFASNHSVMVMTSPMERQGDVAALEMPPYMLGLRLRARPSLAGRFKEPPLNTKLRRPEEPLSEHKKKSDARQHGSSSRAIALAAGASWQKPITDNGGGSSGKNVARAEKSHEPDQQADKACTTIPEDTASDTRAFSGHLRLRLRNALSYTPGRFKEPALNTKMRRPDSA
eukprot:jgi/Mesvir1/15887/Mv02792-RA.3